MDLITLVLHIGIGWLALFSLYFVGWWILSVMVLIVGALTKYVNND